MTTPSKPADPATTNRRHFLSRSVSAGLALAAATTPLPAAQPQTMATTQPSPGDLPTGQLDKLKVSRLISGGNLLSGWCHQRDLLFVAQLAQAYLTEKKQFDTLQLLEESGVNTIMIDMDQLPIVNKYNRQRGGKTQTIVAVREDWGDWSQPSLPALKAKVARTIDQGPDLLFLHGGYCDRLVHSAKPEHMDHLGKALACLRDQGYTAGLGSHALEVPIECDKRGIQPDYYVKTFHHDRYWSATPKDRRKRFCVDGPRSLDHNEFHDNIFCIDPEDTISYMLTRKQPWIAFKVLAAGAIDPRSGFTYALENGADFLAIGMFDFNVAEDVMVIKEVLKNVKRQRPWRA